jgi:hypothetical protein
MLERVHVSATRAVDNVALAAVGSQLCERWRRHGFPGL